jgi:hypothetical protein
VAGLGSRDDTVEFNAGEPAGDAKRLTGSRNGGRDLQAVSALREGNVVSQVVTFS